MRESEGKPERHRIFIYEEDFAKVSQALLETIMQISDGVLQEMPDLGRNVPSQPHEEPHHAPQPEDVQIGSFDLEWTDEA